MHEHRDQPDQRAVVGEDPDDVGAPADLAVEALERVGRAQLAPVFGREGVEGEQSSSASSSSAAILGSGSAQLVDRLAEPLAGLPRRSAALKIGRISAASSPCWSLRACPRQSLRKWTVQRCQGRRAPAPIAAFSPACASEMTSCTPTEAALDQAAQEAAPERLGLGFADVEADDLAAARSHGRRGRPPRLADDAAAVADLLDLRVERTGRGSGPPAAASRNAWTCSSKRRQIRLTSLLVIRSPSALDDLIDPPRRDAADIGLLDHRSPTPAPSAGAAPETTGSSCRGAASGSASSISPARVVPPPAADTRCDASRRSSGARSPCPAPISSDDLDLHQLLHAPRSTLADHIEPAPPPAPS